jgi:hypothetical protein
MEGLAQGLLDGFLGPTPPQLARGADEQWFHWLWLFVPIGVYLMICFGLFAFGRSDKKGSWKFFFQQIDNSLERATGFPGWAMAGSLSGLMALLIAVIGMYWDIAWHIDYGRDTQLFTVSHTMILTGFGMLFWAAAVSVLFASLDEAETGLRMGRNKQVRIPLSAVLMGVFAAGGMAAFPFDALWHKAYGIDVTLWSPSHIMLVAGGSFATFACWFQMAEARPYAKPNMLGRGIYALAGGACLAGLSTLQAEFDFSSSQFQVLFLPVMIALAAGMGLVMARIALGPWGTMKAIIAYVVVRGFVSFVVVGGALGHTVPLFPVYVISGLMVEAAAYWLGTDNRFKFALGAGALVGTIGMFGDFFTVGAFHGWSQAMPTELFVKAALLGPVAGVAAALLGAALSQSAFEFNKVTHRIPVPVVALAGVAVVGVLLYPLPRKVGDVHADVKVEQINNGTEAYVNVKLTPVDAAENARAFGVGSWQGGGIVQQGFEPVAGTAGEYRSTGPVPITAPWKTMISLQRNDEMMAVPVFMPADPGIKFELIPAIDRSMDFAINTKYLLPETRPGDPGVKTLAYAAIFGAIAIWTAMTIHTASRIPGLAKQHEQRTSNAPPAPATRPSVTTVVPRPYTHQRIGRW